MLSRHARRTVTTLALPLALLLPACGAADDGTAVRGDAGGSVSGSASGLASGSTASCEPVGDPASADTTVPVTLTEWSVEVDGPVTAGSVALVADDTGAEPHELVVVRAEGGGDLPTDDDGALDEEALPDGAFVGEIEAFPSGETCTGVFDLEPGSYVFLCNLVETESDGTVEAHLAEGMATTVTVEAAG